MAKSTNNDQGFAYTVGKDIAELQASVNDLKHSPTLEFTGKQVVYNEQQVWSQFKLGEQYIFLQTGYVDNGTVYGDNIDGEYFIDPVDKLIYKRIGKTVKLAKTPTVEQIKQLTFNLVFDENGDLAMFPLSDPNHILDMEINEFEKLALRTNLFQFSLDSGDKNIGLKPYIGNSGLREIQIYYKGSEVYKGSHQAGHHIQPY